jgi:hypothetical protein
MRKLGLSMVIVGMLGIMTLFTLYATDTYSCRWEHWPFAILMIGGNQILIHSRLNKLQ